jgi:putative holliday junction resolvase
LRYMGLDVGESRIGVAVSDPLGATAQPFETIKRDEGSISRLAELVGELEVGTVAVGLPLLMDGSEGEQARLVREFAADLDGAIDADVAFIDERLTTKQAESVLREGRVKRSRKRGASDRVAAALILRAYMDGLSEE